MTYNITERKKILKSAKRKFFLFLIASIVIGITLHELGHLLAALSLGLDVNMFSIGFGPKIFSFAAWDIEFQLAALPLGGFVELTEEASILLGLHMSFWQSFYFFSAGVIVNVIIAFTSILFFKKLKRRSKKVINFELTQEEENSTLLNLSTINIALVAFIFANGMLFVFNAFVPWIVLDGWKIWGSILLTVFPETEAAWRIIGRFGLFSILIFGDIYTKLMRPFENPAKELNLLK